MLDLGSEAIQMLCGIYASYRRYSPNLPVAAFYCLGIAHEAAAIT